MILDVRRDSEWAASHIAGAVHIPIHQLPARLAELPAGEVWVHREARYPASQCTHTSPAGTSARREGSW